MQALFRIQDLFQIAPPLILICTALLVLVFQLVLKSQRLRIAFYLTVIAFVAAILVIIFGIPSGGMAWANVSAPGTPPNLDTGWLLKPFDQIISNSIVFHNQFNNNQFTSLFSILILSGSLFVVFFMRRLLSELDLHLVESYVMILFASAGLIFFIGANDLITLFIALELSALPVFVLAGWDRHNRASTESALKYFMLNVFSSAFMLLGIAFLYGAVGSTNLYNLQNFSHTNGFETETYLLRAGWSLLVGGILFKIAVVPFHAWVADVYEGTTTIFTAYMAAMVKIGAIAVGFKMVHFMSEMSRVYFQPLLIIFVILSIILGNISAFKQTNLKRMFAYSSIAHSGYMVALFCFPSGNSAFYSLQNDAGAALIYYVAVYAATSILFFSAIAFFETEGGIRGSISLDHLKGLAHRNKFAGFVFAVCALSLAGLPPLAGFFGKFFLLKVLISGGQYTLAVAVTLGSLMGIGYYLKIVYSIYWDYEAEASSGNGKIFRGQIVLLSGIILAGIITIGGIFSDPFYKIAFRAVQMIK